MPTRRNVSRRRRANQAPVSPHHVRSTERHRQRCLGRSETLPEPGKKLAKSHDSFLALVLQVAPGRFSVQEVPTAGTKPGPGERPIGSPCRAEPLSADGGDSRCKM